MYIVYQKKSQSSSLTRGRRGGGGSLGCTFGMTGTMNVEPSGQEHKLEYERESFSYSFNFSEYLEVYYL